ncbi:MAG: UbiA family prenyltransferase [Phycisphaerales bacterium]
MSRLRAWLALARLSNAPTVATNAFVGFAIGASAVPHPEESDPAELLPVWMPFALALGVMMIYAAGMILNDWFDRQVDAVERPRRPIPSGAIPPRQALLAGAALLLAGCGTLIAITPHALPWALLLAAAVVAYDALHATPAAGIPLMALCRMLAVVVPAVCTAPPGAMPLPLLLWFALPLGAYIAVLSLLARKEVGPTGVTWPALLLPFAALMPLGALALRLIPPVTHPSIYFVGGLIGALIAWHLRAWMPPRRDRLVLAVMGWIAAIPLADATGLLVMGQPALALIAVGCFFATAVGHTRIAGS